MDLFKLAFIAILSLPNVHASELVQMGQYRIRGVVRVQEPVRQCKILLPAPIEVELSEIEKDKILALAKAQKEISDAKLNEVPPGYEIEVSIGRVIYNESVKIVEVLRKLTSIPGKTAVAANPSGLAPAFATISASGAIALKIETERAPRFLLRDFVFSREDFSSILDSVTESFLSEASNRELDDLYDLTNRRSGGGFGADNAFELGHGYWVFRVVGKVPYALWGMPTWDSTTEIHSEFAVFVSVIVKDKQVIAALPETPWDLEALREEYLNLSLALKNSINDPQKLHDPTAPLAVLKIKDNTRNQQSHAYRPLQLNISLGEFHPELNIKQMIAKFPGDFALKTDDILEGAPGTIRFLRGNYHPETDTINIWK